MFQIVNLARKCQLPQMNNLRTICLTYLLFAIFSNQNISANSQDLPKVPAVIAQTEFDYQGEHFVVQLIPSSDAVIHIVDFPGGGAGKGDFIMTSAVPTIVLRSGSKVLREITALQDARFFLHIPDPNWYAYGTAPLFFSHVETNFH